MADRQAHHTHVHVKLVEGEYVVDREMMDLLYPLNEVAREFGVDLDDDDA